jgi:hypothetical protein
MTAPIAVGVSPYGKVRLRLVGDCTDCGRVTSEARTATHPHTTWRRAVVVTAVSGAIAAMGAVYWERDLRYALPTPRPASLHQVPRGEVLTLPAAFARLELAADRPLLVHFYNPDCPCSRFNRDHVALLQRRYGDRVQFVEVVEVGEPTSAAAPSGVDTPWLADPDGAIAAACGVYATPQALLLDAARRVVFRGNFNSARFCDARATQFARQAIDDLLHGVTRAVDPRAEAAYGCPLPQEDPDAPRR